MATAERPFVRGRRMPSDMTLSDVCEFIGWTLGVERLESATDWFSLPPLPDPPDYVAHGERFWWRSTIIRWRAAFVPEYRRAIDLLKAERDASSRRLLERQLTTPRTPAERISAVCEAELRRRAAEP